MSALPKRTVFVDTFYWVALINPRDSSHLKALEFSRSLGHVLLVTTDEVLTEVLAYFSGHGAQPRLKVAQDVRDILADEMIRVIPQSRESFLAGLHLYESRLDKGYSLTDCISMNVMRSAAISDILSNDGHFAQEGFNALFRVA